jgi:hypothetical protein
MPKVTTSDIIQALENTRTNIKILMAYGDGKIKRELGIRGDYKKYLDVSFRSLMENAFYLVVSMNVINRHPIVKLIFERQAKKLDAAMGLANQIKDGDEPKQ